MEATDTMEFPDRETEKSKSRVDSDSSAERILAETSASSSTSDERASLLTLARSGFTRSDTEIGADGKLDIPPIFPTFTTATSVLESKQKTELRTARVGDASKASDAAPTRDSVATRDVAAPTTEALFHN